MLPDSSLRPGSRSKGLGSGQGSFHIQSHVTRDKEEKKKKKKRKEKITYERMVVAPFSEPKQ